MSLYYRLKRNFSAGEVSPLMYGRGDFERYKNGCKQLLNMISATQGPATRRSGTQFIYDIEDLDLYTTDPKFRMVPFVFNELQAYVMLFFTYEPPTYPTDPVITRVVFATDEGLVEGTGVATPYDLDTSLPYTGPGDYETSYADGATINSSSITHTSSSLAEATLSDGNGYTVVNSGGVSTFTIEADFDSETVLDFTGTGDYEVSYPSDSTINSVTVKHISAALVETTLNDPGDYTVVDSGGTSTFTVTTAPTSDGTLEITQNITLAEDGTIVITQNISNPIVPLGDVVVLDMPEEWDIESFDYAQSGDYLFVAQSGLNPHAIARRAHDSWEIRSLIFTDQPDEWTDTNGWPETVTFFQQRLVFGASTLRRQTIWASRAGDFYHFGQLDTTLVDSDAVSFTIDSGTQNKIQWLQSVRQLHAGTIGNEWVITGNGQTAITPSSVLTQSHTNNGSEKIKPLRVGLTTMFVERHGRVVNEFVYDYSYDSFKTSDITILAPHLTKDSSIKSWAYQQVPGSIVWCVRDDGDVIALTYQRQHNVVGWHHHTTEGEFLDVCSIPGQEREDEVWFVVKRSVNGSDKYYLEKKALSFESDDPKDGRFLDSFITYSGTATSTITGLDHLEGESVSILADGAVQSNREVSSGEITLDGDAEDVVVGLPFSSEVRPLLVDVELKDGTILTRKQRVIDLRLLLYNTVGCFIGWDHPERGEIVEELPFRKPDDTPGEALPLFSGVLKHSFMEGWATDCDYFIRQTYPLPLTVIGIVDKMEVL